MSGDNRMQWSQSPVRELECDAGEKKPRRYSRVFTTSIETVEAVDEARSVYFGELLALYPR